MQTYTNVPDAISHLHHRRFTDDFQACSKKVFWVQEGITIPAKEFAMLEYHSITLVELHVNYKIAVIGIASLYYQMPTTIKTFTINKPKNL
jgi:hypothetical protein